MPHPLYSVSDISKPVGGGGEEEGGGGAPFRPLRLRGVERERKEVDLWEF
jgi:hypothetical protein